MFLMLCGFLQDIHRRQQCENVCSAVDCGRLNGLWC